MTQTTAGGEGHIGRIRDGRLSRPPTRRHRSRPGRGAPGRVRGVPPGAACRSRSLLRRSARPRRLLVGAGLLAAAAPWSSLSARQYRSGAGGGAPSTLTAYGPTGDVALVLAPLRVGRRPRRGDLPPDRLRRGRRAAVVGERRRHRHGAARFGEAPGRPAATSGSPTRCSAMVRPARPASTNFDRCNEPAPAGPWRPVSSCWSSSPPPAGASAPAPPASRPVLRRPPGLPHRSRPRSPRRSVSLPIRSAPPGRNATPGEPTTAPRAIFEVEVSRARAAGDLAAEGRAGTWLGQRGVAPG